MEVYCVFECFPYECDTLLHIYKNEELAKISCENYNNICVRSCNDCYFYEKRHVEELVNINSMLSYS